MSKYGEWTEAELVHQLSVMEECKNTLYTSGVALNNARLIHFSGMLSVLINMCRDSLREGRCFMDRDGISPHGFQLAYLAEKFLTAFSGGFQDDENKEKFLKELGWIK